MWGNRLGWGLSAGVVLLVLGAIALVEMANSVSPATALGKQAAGMHIVLPMGPETVLGTSEAGEAGSLYREVIALVQENPQAFDNPVDAARQRRVQPAMDKLIGTTRLSQMELFSRKPEEVVKYDYPGHRREELKALASAGNAALTVGLLRQRERKFDEAKRHFEAAFGLGAKLFGERVVLDELIEGQNLMLAAARGLAGLAEEQKETARAEELKRFIEQMKGYWEKEIDPVQAAIITIDPVKAQRHAGDALLLAGGAGERMWRIEALLQLGRLRRLSSRGGDQRGALRAAAQIAEDENEDPAVRLAARLARELSAEEFRMQGG